MITVTKPALLCDTGLLSRVFLAKAPFLDAYLKATETYQEIISTAVFIELQHWLLIQRGLAIPISRAEYDRHRKRLENLIVLNSDGVSEQALNVARRWPDTGVGDAYTIATALVFDVPVFTLNPKHFERMQGIQLYKPENYQLLLQSTRRS
ncbi:type II toxin-antitoxin system VapC family toxin [Spirosoma spitsbergense]|uniref:type II toxin-antitoxin system VapC family toxin n=1 Tax=Spirosoma spitsbergense TaxID=431554 RepID=UPI0003667AC8|nr:PIN domain-containing protein [Spirosoma spitsbergense]